MLVFLSYHNEDYSYADSFKRVIERADPEIIIFMAPHNFNLGTFWVPAISNAITSSDGFLFLIGERTGNWQLMEYYEALDRKVKQAHCTFPLVPVKIAERLPNVPFLGQFHWIERIDPNDTLILPAILSALKGKQIPAVLAPWQALNPYRGLEALREEDSEFFFGRAGKTAEILNAIIQQQGKLITLIGNSGVGKSSLVQAGVIGSLKQQRWPDQGNWPEQLKDSRTWLYLIIRAHDDPIREVASAFTKLWFKNPTDPRRPQCADTWREHLINKGHLKDLIDATYDKFTELGIKNPQRILLYLDQGEELYSRSHKNPCVFERFNELLVGAVEENRLVIMSSLRADYYGKMQQNRQQHEVTHLIDVLPLNSDELRLVLSEPAKKLKVQLENEYFIDKLIEATSGQAGILPLLADLMNELWEKMQERGDGILRMLLDEPKEIPVGASLTKRADLFLESNPGKKQAIKRLFTLKLIDISEKGEPTRLRLLKINCTDDEWPLIEKMADMEWRLLVTGDYDGIPFAEIAHDILLSRWKTLDVWVEEERGFLVWRKELHKQRVGWEKMHYWQREYGLLSEADVKKAMNNSSNRETDIASEEKKFIKKSAFFRKAKRLVAGSIATIFFAIGIALMLIINTILHASSKDGYILFLNVNFSTIFIQSLIIILMSISMFLLGFNIYKFIRKILGN